MISQALTYAYPGAQWSLVGETYAGLTWVDTVVPKPSIADVQAAVTAYQAHVQAVQYLEKRLALYPSIHQRLLAIEVQVAALVAKTGATADPVYAQILSQIQSINTQFPPGS